MRILISKTKCNYLAVVLVMMILSCILISIFNQNNEDSLKKAVIVQFVTFLVMFFVLGYANKALITLYSVFLAIFYIFQNGQLLLYTFGFNFDYYYVEKFSAELLIQSVLFSNLCMCSAFAAAIFSFDEKKGWVSKRIDVISTNVIYEASRIGLILSGIEACGLMAIKLVIWLGGGYSAIIIFEAAVPSILGMVEALFPAFCILTIVSGVKMEYRTRMVTAIFLLWGILTAMIGDRTTGIGVIVIVLLMYYYGLFSSIDTGKSFDLKKKVMFAVGGLVTLFLIAFAANFRNHDEFTLGSLFSVIGSVIYELGFSFFPLSAIMDMCPGTHSFLYGESMFSSAVTGFFPESLDVLGIFNSLADKASIPTHWIADRYQYGFGMDCSLNAEVYANFGMFGFVAMFVICAFVAASLKKVDYKSDKNVFSQYVGFALLFGWFTLPRRRSYYIYNKIFWYVLMIGAAIGIVYLISKKRGYDAKSK